MMGLTGTFRFQQILLFYRLWCQLELDVLIVYCYVAQYSAFNKTENLWAPLSRRLVVFPAVLEGDSVPPERMTGLSAAEKERKEAEAFDKALEELTHAHWDGVKFDDCVVSTKFLPCKVCESATQSYQKQHQLPQVEGVEEDVTSP